MKEIEMKESDNYYERLCKVIKYYVGCESIESIESIEVSINEIYKVEYVKRLCKVLECKELLERKEVLECKVLKYNIKSEEDYRNYIFGGEGLRLNGYERYL